MSSFGAEMTTGPQIADWLATGLHIALAITASIYMTKHILTKDHPNRLTRLMHAKLFYHFLAIEWLHILTNIGEWLMNLFYDRGDGIIVSYLPVLMNVFIYSIMAHILSIFLRQDLLWVESTQYQMAGAMLCHLMYAVQFDLGRYFWYAIGVAWVYWVYHILVCYFQNEKEDEVASSTIFVLTWIFLSWTISIAVIPAIGHYGGASISFTTETWLRNVFAFTSTSIPALLIAFYVNGYQAHLASMLEERGFKFFTSRLKTTGYIGSYLITGHLVNAPADILGHATGSYFTQEEVTSGDRPKYF